MAVRYGLLLTFTALLLNFAQKTSDAADIVRERGISVQARPSLALTKQNYSASYALVIGIDNYTQGWPKLQNAVKDAELIAAEMTRRGFDVTLRKNLRG